MLAKDGRGAECKDFCQELPAKVRILSILVPLIKEAIFDMIATKRRRKEIKIYHRNQGRGDRVEDDREMAGEPVGQTEAAHAADVLWSRT